jgi:hypothetical protein
VPLGAEQGWETAVLDHFNTVAKAIARKVQLGFQPASADDRIGGSTYTFSVTPEHPFRQEVYELLRQTRIRSQSLWERVAAHNEAHPPPPDEVVKVSFYVGQTLELADREDGSIVAEGNV